MFVSDISFLHRAHSDHEGLAPGTFRGSRTSVTSRSTQRFVRDPLRRSRLILRARCAPTDKVDYRHREYELLVLVDCLAAPDEHSTLRSTLRLSSG